MSGIRFFNIRRAWEYRVGMLIGVRAGLSRWLVESQYDQDATWNAALVGAFVFDPAKLEYCQQPRKEIDEVAGELLLIASPSRSVRSSAALRTRARALSAYL